ncbi:hypothetical protein C0989_005747 [Termitomyces sp. Mn162]|nr:hypothetical protein C0989_005747 [Termitomyces sp. Mn162]
MPEMQEAWALCTALSPGPGGIRESSATLISHHAPVVSNFHLSTPTHPVLALAPTAPAACPLLLGIPMDMDVARQLCTALLLCQRCKKPGHFAWHYPLGLEVCYLSMAEQEELLLQLLAAKDTAGALLLDEPKSELTPEEDDMCSSPPEFKGDF